MQLDSMHLEREQFFTCHLDKDAQGLKILEEGKKEKGSKDLKRTSANRFSLVKASRFFFLFTKITSSVVIIHHLQ